MIELKTGADVMEPLCKILGIDHRAVRELELSIDESGELEVQVRMGIVKDKGEVCPDCREVNSYNHQGVCICGATRGV